MAVVTAITVVLAAGRGRRLGGPKALLCWPLLPQKWLVPLGVAHVEARRESARVVVVTRADVADVLREVSPTTFAPAGRGRLVVSAAADELGPAGSLAAAVAAGLEGDVVLVTPVDCPPARDSTVRALLDALESNGDALAAKPRYEGRGGHPVALRARALTRYRDVDPPPLRDHLRTFGERLLEVPVSDETVRLDIDEPADFEGWARRHGGGAVDEVAFFRGEDGSTDSGLDS